MPSGSRLVTAFGTYTSGSRHREQSFIVTSDGAERAEIAGRRPLGDRRAITPSDMVANVTRNFSRQDEKESAVSMLERAANVRRGTIQAVQSSLQPMEARTAAEEQMTSLPQRLERRRIRRALESRLPGLAERLAAIARAKRAERQSERDYWQEVAERASKATEQAQSQSQTRRSARRR